MADGYSPGGLLLGGLRAVAATAGDAANPKAAHTSDKENEHPQGAPPASPGPGFGRPPPTPQSILKRRLALAQVPGSSAKGGVKKQKRRVSFAPAAELETMHLYQVQEESPVSEVAVNEIGQQDQLQTPPAISAASPRRASPRLRRSPRSPGRRSGGAAFSPAGSKADSDSMSMDDGSTMDLTDCTSRMVQLGDDFDVLNTVALPSLTQLAEEEEEEEGDEEWEGEPASATPQRDLTGELPELGDLAEEDETLEGARKQLDLGGGSDYLSEDDDGGGREGSGLTAQLNSLALMMQREQQAAGGVSAVNTPNHTTTMDIACTPTDVRSMGAVTPLTAQTEVDVNVTGGRSSSVRNDTDMDISSGMTGQVAGVAAPARSVPASGGAQRVTDEMTMGYSKIWEQGAHPTWGAEAETAEDSSSGGEERPDGSPEVQAPGVQAQRDRWGVVPGQDDTLDIDLEVNARNQMGDMTWRHVYGTESGTGEITRKIRLGDYLSEDEDGGVEEKDEDVDMEITGGIEPPVSPQQREAEEIPAILCQPSISEEVQVGAEVEPAVEEQTVEEVAAGVAVVGQADISIPINPIELSGMKPPRPRRRTSLAFSMAGTPTGHLDAGATTRLLVDDGLTPEGEDMGRFNTKTPSAFGFSESMVPLTLSAGSKAPDNRTITCGATTALLASDNSAASTVSGTTHHQALVGVTPQAYCVSDDDGLVPLSLSGGSKTGCPERAIVDINSADRQPSQGELRLDSAFGVALAETEDSPLNTSESPTRRLSEFGNIPTPSKPSSVQAIPLEIKQPQAFTRTQSGSRGGGLADLEGTFQALAGQLESLKPKAGRKADNAPNVPDAAPEAVPGGPKLARTPPGTQSSADNAVVPGGPTLNRGPKTEADDTDAKMNVESETKLAKTPPAAAAVDAVAPMEEVSDAAKELEIIGGPKLARTPPGQSYAAPSLFAAVTPQSTVVPGARAFPSPAPAPFGLNAPPAATPSGSLTTTAVPISFKSFLNLADVRFLDRLRRGTSGVGLLSSGLEREPPPKTLSDAYKLMCVTTAELEENENRLAVLNAEVDSRKRGISAKEAQLDASNPDVFHTLQLAMGEEAVSVKAQLAALKASCRARSVQRWKRWRADRELELGKRLQENHTILKQDVQFAATNQAMMNELLGAVRAHAAQVRGEFTADREAGVSQRGAAEEEEAALGRKTAEVRSLDGRASTLERRVDGLRRRLESLGRQREELVDRWKAAKEASHSPVPEVSARDVLEMDERLEIAQGLSGWRLEGAADSLAGLSSGEVTLRFGSLARLKLELASNSDDPKLQPCVNGVLELPPPGVSSGLQAEQLAVAARFLCAGARLPLPAFPLPAESVDVGSVVGRWKFDDTITSLTFFQELSASVSRLQCFLQDIGSLRLQVPALTDAKLSSDGGTLELRFMDFDAGCLFTAAVAVWTSYPAGPMRISARVQLPGKHGLTAQVIESAANQVPEQYGRVQKLCLALGDLASGGQ